MKRELPCCKYQVDLRYISEQILLVCPICKKKYRWSIEFKEVE